MHFEHSEKTEASGERHETSGIYRDVKSKTVK